MGVPLRAAAQKALVNGLVIPAHPLALTSERKLDERAQRALTRYYAAAGAGGIAVGVHTTQFEIREPRHGLLRPVLELAAQSVREHEEKSGVGLVLVAGVCGRTQQAVAEASFAREAGYDVGLVSLAALADESDEALRLRLRNARKEAARLCDYDYIVVNDDLDRATREVANIVRSEGCRESRLEIDGLDLAALPADSDSGD